MMLKVIGEFLKQKKNATITITIAQTTY